jgi:hypothetical protein
MNKLTGLIQRIGRFFDRNILFPFWKTLHSFSGRQMAKPSADKGLGEWKEQAIEDFSVWLSQVETLPDPRNGDPMEECDLYTLLAEFVSLKKQIQLQNREQSKNIRGLKDFNTFARQGHAVITVPAYKRITSRPGSIYHMNCPVHNSRR